MSGKHAKPRGSKPARADEAAEPMQEMPAEPQVQTEPQVPRTSGVRSGVAVQARPAVIELAPAVPGEIIVPGPTGPRVAAHEQRARRRHRLALGSLAGIVVLALVAGGVWLSSAHHHTVVKPVVAAAPVRTQRTVLIQLSGSLGVAVDSALVAHDSAHHDGVMVLVPSQVIARVPGFGPMPFGQALTVGDPSAPRATLSDLVGVTVDGSWTLDPQAMAALIDQLGGVTVDVDRDVTRTSGATTTIVVPAGNRKLDGASAVAFASFLADGETEQSRLSRFDTVLTAVLGALPKQPAQVAAMVSSLGAGSASSLPAGQLAGVLVGLAADNAANATDDQMLPVDALDTGDGEQSFSLDAAKTQQLVSQQLAGSVPSERKTTGNRVLVENQVGTPGIGESTRVKLEQAGFIYIAGPNAPGMPDPTSPSAVLIFDTTAASIAKGDDVAKALGLPTSDVKIAQQTLTAADVVAIIGADYRQ